ncbi:MAG: nuclease-related domain-containing protein [Actinomycetota bacterium]
MSEPGRSAEARSASIRDLRRQTLRRRWPIALVGVIGAFAVGYFLPRLILAATSSFLVGLVPDSAGVAEPSFLPSMSLALGTLMAGAAAVGLLRPSRSEVAWSKGASGERRVGRMLDRLGGKEVAVLHDRTIPGSRANIDHLAITPSGVFTIETKRYKGRLEVRARSAQLWINRRNRSNLLTQAHRQAESVQETLTRAGLAEVPVTPVLCFVETRLPLLMPKQVGGVMICTPNMLRRRLTHQRSQRMSPDRVAATVESLDAKFRPAGGG